MLKIADVIEFKGNPCDFVWKSDCTNFNSLTQLIVHESQEAVFFMNGQALDLFGPGRHTLETQNLPIIGKLFNRLVGDKTPFHCEVYFINKTEQMSDIKWGTSDRIEYIDPTYKFPLSIGLSGEMSVHVDDSRKLLVKLVGTKTAWTVEDLKLFFRAFLMTRIKSYIAQSMRSNAISIFELDEHLISFSQSLNRLLMPDFADYGVCLDRFFITGIKKPDGEQQYEKFKELHFRQYADIAEAKLKQQTDIIFAQTEAQKLIIDSKAQATKRATEGYTYQQERGFDVASEVARNEAVGQFTNLGVGLGTMAGVGGAVAGTVGSAMSDALNITNTTPSPSVCTKCNASIPANSKFCLACGERVEKTASDNMITCPSCGKTVAKGKFCLECGHKLIIVCSKCSKEIIPGAKFCLECGEKI
ncbi:MAG: SPFH domain-containing protein [Clostridia bacterium]|nr:SPFH domain-containing protein [Clostridia bacterium]